MRDEAASQPTIETEFGRFPALQVFTLAELFQDRRPEAAAADQPQPPRCAGGDEEQPQGGGAGGIALKPDLPFSPKVVAYIGKRLRALGIEPDREWIDKDAGDNLDMFLLDSHLGLINAARNAIPTSRAHWEMADFYRYAVPPAVFDLGRGVITRYPEFAFLYQRLLGPRSLPWLRSIFLAAAASPTFDEDMRVELVGRFPLDHLRFEPDEEPRFS